MKKLFLILNLMFVIMVTSCDYKDTCSNNSNELSDNIEKVTYEGHEYLIFIDGYGEWRITGFTHSGNCPCLKNDSIINKKDTCFNNSNELSDNIEKLDFLEKVTYEGHEYFIFIDGYDELRITGFTHSGNCPCLKNDSIINK